MAHAEEERKALGRDLAQARKNAGFSMETAAAELTRRGFPITKQTIGAWEVGRNLPDTLWLRRLARLYRTTTDELTGEAGPSGWPFTDELHRKVLVLSDEALYKLERAMRAHLDMPHISLSDFANTTQLATVEMKRPAHTRGPEEGLGLPDNMQVPESKVDVQGSTNRRRPHRKGGSGA